MADRMGKESMTRGEQLSILPETHHEDRPIEVPVGKLMIAPLKGCEPLARQISDWIYQFREEEEHEMPVDSPEFDGYMRKDYILEMSLPRFGTGEGKCVIQKSVRGCDVFILCDMFNHGVTMDYFYGEKNARVMSPDEHYADLKRVIAAITGKARRVNVIMPMLYEGRQHRRTTRESLDCALVLKELCDLMGVDNIITFDAHDPRVQNAIPLNSFEDFKTAHQMIKAVTRDFPDIKIDPDHLMIISPDEGGMGRCIFYATVLGVELSTFYKERDYTTVVNGRNPVKAHMFLGGDIRGRDVFIVDDMISSGGSMLDTAAELKKRGAGRIFILSAFGLFTDGLGDFDEEYAKGTFSGVFTTNLIYRTPELLEREWYHEVDLSKYIALIVNNLNKDQSVSPLIDPSDRIDKYLRKHGYRS